MKIRNFSRRSFFCLSLGLALFVADPANTRPFHGGVSTSVPSGTLITTKTLKNDTTTTQTVDNCTHMFGHPFAQGDIPAGQYPVWKTSGNTVIPFSMSVDNSTHPDGSLKHATFRFRLPVAITSLNTLGCLCYNGGSAPTPSTRALSDFNAADLNVLVTAQDNMGTPGLDWVASLNQGILAGFSDNYVFMDGDAGKDWRIRANFQLSGADHSQLESWWYISSLPDSSGALGGLRYLVRLVQPKYNETTVAPQYRSFTAMKTRTGTTLIRDFMASLPAAKSFTWSGSGKILNATGHGFITGIFCKLSNVGGSLPSPLTTTDLYCVAVNDANSFGVSSDPTDTAGNGMGAAINLTTAGSGTHTATMYPMIAQFGSLFTAETNGRFSYIKSTGSVAADCTITSQMNSTYWCRTKCLPPYLLSTITPASNTSVSYYIGTSGSWNRNLGATGEIEQIAQVSSFFARHVFTQATVDDQVVRVNGLAAGHLSMAMYDKTTRSIPVCNNGTYSGMPTANNNFRWYGNGSAGNFGGFTPPSITNMLSQCWTYIDSSHVPAMVYYPFLLTGEPQYKDMLAEVGNLALYQGYPNSGSATVNGTTQGIGFIRNGTINGITRAGIFFGADGLRTVAWAIRDLGSTAIAKYKNPAWNTYFNDILNDTFDGWADYRTMLAANAAPFVTANGMWQESVGNLLDAWTMGYFIGAIAHITGINSGYARGITFLNYLVKWPAYISNTFSPYLVGYYRALGRQGTADTSPYIASSASLAMYAWHIGWTSVGNLFTLNSVPSGYTINNDDVFAWNSVGGGDGSSPPAGATPTMVGYTPYYVINKSGTGVGATFQLSTSIGGSAIVLADIVADALVYGRPKTPPSTGSIDSILGSGYVANIVGVCGWAKAIGATVDATFLTALTSRLTGAAGYLSATNTDPKYAIGSVYV